MLQLRSAAQLDSCDSCVVQDIITPAKSGARLWGFHALCSTEALSACPRKAPVSLRRKGGFSTSTIERPLSY